MNKPLVIRKVDVILTSKIKLDKNFPSNLFSISDFLQPIRLLRNRNRGDIMIYVTEYTPTKELAFVNLPRDLESIFVQVNLLNRDWLLCESYYPPHQQDKYFFNLLGNVVDKYTQKYNAGDS